MLEAIDEAAPGAVAALLEASLEHYLALALREPGELPGEPRLAAQARRARRERSIARGRAISTVSDALTANLSLLALARDAIDGLSPAAARSLLARVRDLVVLDPTCGTGRFLAAAFEVLFELQAALARRSGESRPSGGELARTIVSRQLHGVDLLPEAVEICRAHLRDLALGQGAAAAEVLGVRAGNAVAGFDWQGEFGPVVESGGFDFVLGNPPYQSVKRLDYRPRGPHAHRDVYGHVVDASMGLCKDGGAIGLVLPLSIAFGRDQAALRERMTGSGESWFASFDNIPAALFAGVSQRVTIWLGRRSGPPGRVFVTELMRWRAPFRPHLLETLSYTELLERAADLPRLGGDPQREILARLGARAAARAASSPRPDAAAIGYSQSARNFVSVFLDDPPSFEAATLEPVRTTKIARVQVPTPEVAEAALAALSGDLFFWYWLTRGDGFDVTSWLVRDFLAALWGLSPPHLAALARIGRWLWTHRMEALVFKKNAGRFVGNYHWRKLGSAVKLADRTLALGLGLDAQAVAALASDVERILSINAFAGEKALPPELVAMRAEQRHTRPPEALRELEGEISKLLAYSCT